MTVKLYILTVMLNEKIKYTLDELIALVDLPRRTVRYYIQIGLVDRPDGAGRGAHYTVAHLDQLLEIRKWQQAGLSLDRIRELLAPDAEELLRPPPRPRQKGSPAHNNPSRFPLAKDRQNCRFAVHNTLSKSWRRTNPSDRNTLLKGPWARDRPNKGLSGRDTLSIRRRRTNSRDHNRPARPPSADRTCSRRLAHNTPVERRRHIGLSDRNMPARPPSADRPN